MELKRRVFAIGLILFLITPLGYLNENPHSVIFTEIGKVIAIGPSYLFSITLDIQPYLAALTDLSLKLNRIKSKCDTYLDNKEYTTNETIEAHLIEKTLSTLIIQIGDAYQDLSTYLVVLGDTEIKRMENRFLGDARNQKIKRNAILQPFGELSKLLFGTALNSDLDAVIHRIQDLEINEGTAYKTINTHTTLINTTIYEVVDLKRHIKKVDEYIEHIHTQVVSFLEKSVNLSYLSYLITLTQHVIASIEELSFKILRLKTALDNTKLGQMDSYLFPPKFCLNILQEVELKVKRRLPYIVTRDNLAEYFHIARVFLSKKDDFSIRLIVIIPL